MIFQKRMHDRKICFTCLTLKVRERVALEISEAATRGVLRKRCSENMQQIYRRIAMRSVILIKLLCNFIEITLRHGCSVYLLLIFRTPFTKKASGRLLLKIC